MFRLAHLSDIHLGPLPEVSYRELVSKRITGYINWQRNRKRAMFGDTLLNLVADSKADLLVVGNKGLNSIAGRLLGSVPANVARRAKSDVLIVHTT